MNNLFKITLGDWSGDGHNETHLIILETEDSVDDIKRAFREFCETKLDLRDFCSDYEDNKIPLSELEKAGITKDILTSNKIVDDDEWSFSKDQVLFNRWSYSLLILYIFNNILGFTVRELRIRDFGESMGYGLFSN
jgi:hypothetical protein